MVTAGDQLRPDDPQVRHEAIKLMEYLRDTALANKSDVLDLDSFEDHWWLTGLPPEVTFRDTPGRDGSLMRLEHVRLPSAPPLPPALHEHIDHRKWSDPQLRDVPISGRLAV